MKGRVARGRLKGKKDMIHVCIFNGIYQHQCVPFSPNILALVCSMRNSLNDGTDRPNVPTKISPWQIELFLPCKDISSMDDKKVRKRKDVSRTCSHRLKGDFLCIFVRQRNCCTRDRLISASNATDIQSQTGN